MKPRLLLFSTLFWIISGCVSAHSASQASGILSDLTMNSSGPESARAFKKVLLAADSSQLEKARIDYLLERISESPYNFIRNGRVYDGKRASMHLRWKHFRHSSQAKTAEDFLKNIAASSKMSGEPYSIQLPDKKRYPLRPILEKELQALDEAIQNKKAETSPSE